MMRISEIFKNTNYGDSLFNANEISAIERRITIRVATGKAKETAYITCLVRNKDIRLTPEEVVRQLYAYRLLNTYGYTADRVKFEYEVTFGREKKRADIVIVDKERPDTAYIIIEVKKPKQKDGKEQLKSYTNATGAPIAVWTNGQSIFIWNRRDPNYFEPIPNLPRASEQLADVISERYTYADLKARDKIANERTSLRDLILDMEDEVLANAGVDAFEEVFKLILAKLYDELVAANDDSYYLRFRNSGETETKLKAKIEELFNSAKDKWDGIFSESTRIALTPSLLSVCVSTLQDVKLFNNNLDVVDDAFEYLMSKTAKSEKGQYFTPRYVIDMCVKMMNPHEGEDIIDTAAGSSGFTVHSIFKVWRDIRNELGLPVGEGFTTDKRTTREKDFVRNHVFAIDYDEKPVRVARTLNLIAGDGQTNVLYLNTLDYGRWGETTKEQDWIDKYNDGFKRLRKRNTNGVRSDDYSQFSFDLLMANPPFAGDVKEGTVLSKYELGKNAKGKMQSTVSRHILFIERNLNFLKPGGRMAIVLPQGIFNNSTEKYIRDYIAVRCRILAVVGLHGNVFKPHTGTKTSVLFVQKWDDEFCPHREDYPIFFATMQKSSKDNSGDKIYVMDSERGEPKLDGHGHLIVDHDLYNHDGITEDGIAEAFIEFAKRENLSFFAYARPFDADRYAALMSGLEAVEIKLSGLERTNRIDSEFYRKENLIVFDLLKKKNYALLTDSFHVSDGNHMSISDDFRQDGIRYYRGADIYNFFIEEASPICISEESFSLPVIKRSHLKKDDILMSIVGAIIGNIALVRTEEEQTCSCKLAIFRPRKGVDSITTAVYLKTRYAQNQIQKFRRGTAQTGFLLEDAGQIVMPVFSSDFCKTIIRTITKMDEILQKATTLYAAAETHLLSALGMDNFTPSNEPVAVKSFSESFGVSGRLDAEYYQRKYEEVLRKLSDFNCDILNSLVWIKKSIEPGSDEYVDEGIPFVRVADLTKYGISQTEKHLNRIPFAHMDLQPKKDTVLLTKDGTVGIAYKVEENLDIVTSGAILHLMVRNKGRILPDYLVLVLNSFIVRMQAERDTGGSVIQHWRPYEIKEVLIPILDMNTQQQIADDVQYSFELRRQSEKLLDSAKRAVEIAIEDDEDTAMAWLDSAKGGIDNV
jgi:type I restriction enzyme M protein